MNVTIVRLCDRNYEKAKEVLTACQKNQTSVDNQECLKFSLVVIDNVFVYCLLIYAKTRNYL